MGAKISSFPVKTSLVGNEILPVVHNSTNYVVTIDLIKTLITAAQIGHENVDNTADIDKPISLLVEQALVGKANQFHSHDISNISGLATVLAGKAEALHNHAISEITGLATALAAKAEALHNHTSGDISDFTAAVTAVVNTLPVTSDVIVVLPEW